MATTRTVLRSTARMKTKKKETNMKARAVSQARKAKTTKRENSAYSGVMMKNTEKRTTDMEMKKQRKRTMNKRDSERGTENRVEKGHPRRGRDEQMHIM